MRAIFFVLAFALAAFLPTALADGEGKTPPGIRAVSWTVIVREDDAWGRVRSKGSCTVTVDAKGHTWAIGCHHVIADIGKDQRVWIGKPLTENGCKIGVVELQADVVKASEKEDLCLLRIRKEGLFAKPTPFQLDLKPLPVDTRIWHCGSFHGYLEQWVSSGMVQGHDYRRTSGSADCDGATILCHPGSSGGGVFDAAGKFVGVITWKHGEECSFFVPMRRIVPWLKAEGYLFVVDPSAKIPKTIK